MSIVMDPTGAAFCMWEPKDNIGAEVMNEPNSLTWTECVSSDIDEAGALYSDVFGWTQKKWTALAEARISCSRKTARPRAT